MNGRNRAEGWKHAKLSGHENEALVEAVTEKDGSLQERILSCGKKQGIEVVKIDFGGLKETDVDCILGGKTKSKTDMHLYLKDNSSINISIKKSAGGQVFLIGVDRFIEAARPDVETRPIIEYKLVALDSQSVSTTIDSICKYIRETYFEKA